MSDIWTPDKTIWKPDDSSVELQPSFEFDKDFFDEYKVYIKPQELSLSSRKIESFLEIAKLQKFFQCNPLRFIDVMFSIDLLDSQALAVQKAWICPNVLIVATRGWGKSTVIDLIVMSKGMLFCNYWTYIASGSGSQAEITFRTLERLANDNIDTFAGSTGYIFKQEVEVKNASGDGFSHSSNGHSYSLYNGATTKTLNSNIDAKRGERGSVIFDESGFLSDEMINVYGAFAIVNKSLKTGRDSSGHKIDPIRQRCFPTNVPNQKFFISSASSISTKFYKLYREFAKNQIMGDPDYAVLHFDCELAFKPTLHGELVAPLLSKGTVRNEMRTNPEKARREFYCQFTTEAGASAIVRRGVISRNEETRVPLLENDTGDKKFIITYDPARSRDNSVITVGQVYWDGEGVNREQKMRIVACYNLMDIGKRIKSPMQTPDQIEFLKEVILEYNAGAEAYGNILGVYIDAGSGGGGVNIADFLMDDWTDKSGKRHRGLIDKEYSADYVKKFPNAVDKVRLMSPLKYKAEMYECLIEMINQDKVKFTSTYDNKGSLTVFDIDEKARKREEDKIRQKLAAKKLSEKMLEEELAKELSNSDIIKTKVIKLDWKEELALANIDAMKEEILNIERRKRDSKDAFELVPEKQGKLHDDRAYTLALACYGLVVERRKNFIANRSKQKSDKNLVQKLTIRKAVRPSSFYK